MLQLKDGESRQEQLEIKDEPNENLELAMENQKEPVNPVSNGKSPQSPLKPNGKSGNKTSPENKNIPEKKKEISTNPLSKELHVNQNDGANAAVSKKGAAKNHDNCPDCLMETKSNNEKLPPRRKRSLDGEKDPEPKSEENLKIKVDHLSDEKVYFKSFQILKNLGEGSFGKVYLVRT
jgi:hypothetical protein